MGSADFGGGSPVMNSLNFAPSPSQQRQPFGLPPYANARAPYSGQSDQDRYMQRQGGYPPRQYDPQLYKSQQTTAPDMVAYAPKPVSPMATTSPAASTAIGAMLLAPTMGDGMTWSKGQTASDVNQAGGGAPVATNQQTSKLDTTKPAGETAGINQNAPVDLTI